MVSSVFWTRPDWSKLSLLRHRWSAKLARSLAGLRSLLGLSFSLIPHLPADSPGLILTAVEGFWDSELEAHASSSGLILKLARDSSKSQNHSRFKGSRGGSTKSHCKRHRYQIKDFRPFLQSISQDLFAFIFSESWR